MVVAQTVCVARRSRQGASVYAARREPTWPYRLRYWLAPKPDPDFFEKSARIRRLYAQAQSAAQAGQRTICVDEMTAIHITA